MKGHDHATVSSDFEEMEKIIESVKIAEKYISKRKLSKNELIIRKRYRGF